jgi:cytosine/adenosine deaminase-related metal-dependent hydrolase
VAVSAAWLDTGGAGSVLASDGLVAEIAAAHGDARRIDARGCTITPGFVDAHTHLYSGLAPLGMPAPSPPPQNFVQILERVWWRLDRALDEASLCAAARLYVAESLLAGTTALIDHHESPALVDGSLDVLAEAAEALGCRLVTCFGATERNGGRDEARRGLRECARFARARRGSALVRGVIGLHASFTVSDDTIREAGDLAREEGVPVHVHVAEDAADVADARARGYESPLHRLTKLGALPPGSILAHGVHLTEHEVAAAGEANLWLVHNPRSNAGNRVGYPRALVASARVALGTDGYPADMRAERDALAAQARAAGQPLDAARIEARVAAGRAVVAERFGVPFDGVAPGRAADLVAWAAPADAATAGARPRHVLVAGEPSVIDGALARGDLEEIRARAKEQAPRLWKRMASIGASP